MSVGEKWHSMFQSSPDVFDIESIFEKRRKYIYIYADNPGMTYDLVIMVKLVEKHCNAIAICYVAYIEEEDNI